MKPGAGAPGGIAPGACEAPLRGVKPLKTKIMANDNVPGYVARLMKELEQNRKRKAAIAAVRKQDEGKVTVPVAPGLWIRIRPDEKRAEAVARFRKRHGMK